MKILNKLELIFCLVLLNYIYLKWPYILFKYKFIRIFDFCMAIYFWSFVACYDREELIELKKFQKKKLIIH